MPSLKLRVPDLCERSDEAKLVRAVCGRPGVYGAVACASSHCIEVDFEDDEVTVQHLIEVLREVGFEAILAG